MVPSLLGILVLAAAAALVVTALAMPAFRALLAAQAVPIEWAELTMSSWPAPCELEVVL